MYIKWKWSTGEVYYKSERLKNNENLKDQEYDSQINAINQCLADETFFNHDSELINLTNSMFSINQNINEWIDFIESIIDAWKTRLEPVFLTSVCTVLWMIPLTLSNPTWTSLWLSIIFWLSVSTVFTLVILPVLYFMFIKPKK